MGPTNVALVKLFRADQVLREAEGRLDAASKNVRLQERRVADLTAKAAAAQAALRAAQAKAGHFDLDLKSRDAHIEKLRTQQQTARTSKEYQVFLVEINTAKVDRGKIEDEAMRAVEAAEKGQAEAAALAAQLEAEKAKLATASAQISETVATLRAEVESLRPARDAAAAALPPRAKVEFERLAERFDGDAMAAIARPDRRREEYACTSCHMDLVADVYNKLHSRDDLVHCPSCRRLLYIPDDLPPELAVKVKPAVRVVKEKAPRAPKGRGAKIVPAPAGGAAADDAPENVVEIEQRAKGKLGKLLAAAQGESVKAAVVSGSDPVDCRVMVDGQLAGFYKGLTPDHLARNIKFNLQEAGLTSAVQVIAEREEADGSADAKADAGTEVGTDAGAASGPEDAPAAVESPADACSAETTGAETIAAVGGPETAAVQSPSTDGA